MTELHRLITADGVGAAGLEVAVEASPAECTALAARMQLPAVLGLSCRFRLARAAGDTIVARGHLVAQVVQTCVISLEDFSATVEDRFVVHFVPAGRESDDADPEAPDEVGYAGGVLDLGEAATEQLALALDPYPRAPGAVLPETPDDAHQHPLAALSALKRRH